jgi:hypothetical protein
MSHDVVMTTEFSEFAGQSTPHYFTPAWLPAGGSNKQHRTSVAGGKCGAIS